MSASWRNYDVDAVLRQAAAEIQAAMQEMVATPESLARAMLSTYYTVPNDAKHIRIDRAEVSDDGVLHIEGAVLVRPANYVVVTITEPTT